MYYLLLEKFNNYENRFMKKFDNVLEYVNYCTAHSLTYLLKTDKSYNFNKRDNIFSNHVFNDDMDPNYVIWINETSGDIVSRWFIQHYTHLSGKQFLAELKRDVLADNYQEVLESPAYIEKGYVSNGDPACFNREDIVVNQIKKKEYKIKDGTLCSWIVGYVAPGSTLDLTMTDYSTAYEYEVGTSFDNWSYYSYCNVGSLNNIDRGNEYTGISFSIANTSISPYSGYWFVLNSNGSFSEFINGNWNRCFILNDPSKAALFAASNWSSNLNWSTMIDKIYLDTPTYVNDTAYNLFMSLNGKKVKFTDGVYTFSVSSSQVQTTWISSENNSNLYNYIYAQISITLNNLGTSISSVLNKPIQYQLAINRFTVTVTKDPTAPGTYTSSMKSTHLNLRDAPYKMFAIPYPDENFYYKVNGIEIDRKLSLSWALELAKGLGSNLYDLQILPYFPAVDYTATGTWASDYPLVNYSLSYKSTGSETKDFMLLKDSNSQGVNIAFFFELSNINIIANTVNEKSEDNIINQITNYKESNELELYRLCSPNYSSCFEFSPAKNNKSMYKFNVYLTYKPYQPFICVAPFFYDLYGQDFRDNRGLILSGDYSLPIITSAWTQYQLNNKNYLLAFDRQIESMELQQEWQNKNAIFSAIAGTVIGGASGAAAGGIAAGLPGAIGGAVLGTMSSAAGGIMDLQMQKSLQREAKSYAKDNFRMNLQNIKALPNTLNKVSSIISISKIYPFLEFYTCTDEEKAAYRNKIKYNGMTIERIGIIKDFLNPKDTTFIKAKLIRNETISGSSDELLEIANELNKGVYI